MLRNYLFINIVLFVACVMYSTSIASQNEISISGVVKDANKEVDGAIVTLFKQSDTTLIKALITEKDGRFFFQLTKPDTVFVVAQMIGYSTFSSDALVVNEGSLVFNIDIVSSGAQMNEVVVKGSTPFIERKIDRVVVNPDAMISNAGITALEVLEKSPGIQVDIDGNISLRGQQGVMVFIDDKPTYLSSTDLANYLRGLPSSSLATIEIMTNPPAKYDAAGSGGVINIKLKKLKTIGLNGNVTASYGQGFYARTNNSLNLNYRVNKVNIFSNFGYSNNGSYQDLTIRRAYFSEGGNLNSGFKQHTIIKKEQESLNAKIGLDYYLSDRSTLGIVFNGFYNKNNEPTRNLAQLTDSVSSLLSTVFAYAPSLRTFSNGTANVNYALKLDTLGQELLFNADYAIFGSDMSQSLLSRNYDSENNFLSESNLVSDLPSTIDIVTAKLDYVKPLKAGHRFDAGAKVSFIETENKANFYDAYFAELTPNYEFSNEFRYKENINAGYVNYSAEGDRFSYQLGLRYEGTIVEGYQLGNPVKPDSTFAREYHNLFPTSYFNYYIDSAKKHLVGLSLGRRIFRPNYQDMNPFTYPLDRFTLYAGNPFLQPSFSYDAELSYTYNNILTVTMYGGQRTNSIFETIEQTDGIFYSRPGNIGTNSYYGVGFNGGFNFTEWWTLQVYAEWMMNIVESSLYNMPLSNSGAYVFVAPNNQFRINERWSAELSGFYQSDAYSGQFITIPVWSARMAAACKILKGQGTLKFGLNDIFYTHQPGGDIKGLDSSTASWFSYLDTRVANISLSYRFAKGQSLAARNVGSSDSEKERVK